MRRAEMSIRVNRIGSFCRFSHLIRALKDNYLSDRIQEAWFHGKESKPRIREFAMKTTTGTIALLLRLWVLASLAAVTVSAAPKPDSPCERILSAESPKSLGELPEAAIAVAWRELLSGERALTEIELVWVEAAANGAEPFDPHAGTFDSAVREGLSDLKTISDRLLEIGSIDALALRALIRTQARNLVVTHQSNRSLEERIREERRIARPAIREFRMEGATRSIPVQLSNGNVVVSSDGWVYFLDPFGSFVTRIKVVGRATVPLELRDGSIVFGDEEGMIRFVNSDGSPRWTQKALRAILASPVQLNDGTVVVGSDDHHVYFLSPDGRVKSRVKTRGEVRSPPVQLTDGTVVVGSDDGSVYFLNPDGTEKSRFPTSGRIYAAPVQLRDGTVVVGSGDGCLYFLTPEGAEKAKFPTGEAIISSPIQLADETVVVGSNDGNVYFVTPNGAEKAKVPVSGRIYAAPVQLRDGTVVFGSTEGYISFVGPDGTVKSEFPTGGAVTASLARIADGNVLVGSWNQRIYLFNPDGSLKIAFKVNGRLRSSFVQLSNGGVAVGTENGSVYFLDPARFDEWQDSKADSGLR